MFLNLILLLLRCESVFLSLLGISNDHINDHGNSCSLVLKFFFHDSVYRFPFFSLFLSFLSFFLFIILVSGVLDWYHDYLIFSS